MHIDHEIWASSAAIRAQDHGADIFEIVDGHPRSDESGFYRGFTASFRLKAGKGSWFHFSLPTPSLLHGKRLALARVTLLWDEEDGAAITWVTLHQGGASRTELSPRTETISGEIVEEVTTPHGLFIRMRRKDFILADSAPVRLGLQLCVFAEAKGQAGTVRFYGAGAAFVDDPTG